MVKNAEQTDDEQPISFESALTDLTQIVNDLEDGSVGLEESLARFEQGMSLLRHCHAILESAEQRIEQLTGFDADGNAQTAPFEATATISERQETAGRRKQAKAPTLKKAEKKTVTDTEGESVEESEITDAGPRLF